MALTFSTSPYYNDYDPKNNEYDVLFRPGFALQVRELGALQSILEEQIRRFGKHIFKEGSMVIPGQVVIDQSVQYVKVLPVYGGNPVAWDLLDPNSDTNDGTQISVKGATTGVEAKVVAVDSINSAIYVKYQGSGTDTTASVIAVNEVINLLPSNTAVAQAISADATGYTAAAAINEGVYFIFGRFVSVPAQYLILAPFNPKPTLRVGLQVTETIVTPEDEPRLTDNAAGTPNFAAPGAHRYRIDLTLCTKDSLPKTQEENQNNNDVSIDDTGFVELMRLEDGVIQRLVDKTIYSEIETMVARRMVDTNGDFTVRPFKFTIREHLYNGGNNGVYTYDQNGDYDKLVIDASPGKAYVSGHEIETLGTSHINMDKARDTAFYANSRTRAYLGNYFYVNRLFSLPSYETMPTANLYDVAISTDGVLPVVTEIGTATLRGVEFDQGTFGAIGAPGPIFKLYVTNINLTTGKKLSDIRSVGVSDGTLTCTANVLHELDLINVTGSFVAGSVITETATSNTETVYAWNTTTNYVLTQPADGTIVASNSPLTSSNTGSATSYGRNVLFDTAHNTLLYPLPQSGVSTVRDRTGAVSTTYSYRKTFTPSAEALGRVTFAVSINEVFASVNVNDYVAAIETGTGAGTLINVATANPVLESGLTQLSFDAPAGTTIKLSATVIKTAATERTKTLQTATKSIASSVPSVINLEKCDVANCIIYEGTDNTGKDIRDRYIFDNGQRDNYYDFGTLTLKAGVPAPTQVYIVFMYYDHGSGDYFSVDSYRNLGGSENWYAAIPTFVSPATGMAYPLSNYLDFRSKRDETDTTNLVFPTSAVGRLVKPNDDIITDFSYYLARVDKLYLDGNGYFRIIRGNPAINPVPPEDPKDGMLLATFWLRPYTYNCKDVTMKVVDNRRYTMRDIGKLEKRIDNLEHYVSLSLLERDTASFSIPDNVTGLDRFKNGFVVDPFANYAISDVNNKDCAFSIDSGAKELHPMFNSDGFNMGYNSTASSNVEFRTLKTTNDLVTLPYTEVAMISQLKASDVENVNPYNVFKYLGSIDLNPSTDTWKDVENAPDILIEDNSQYDAVMAQMGGQGGHGVVWNDWVTDWTGVDVQVQAGAVSSEVKVSKGAPAGRETAIFGGRSPQVGDKVERQFKGTGEIWSIDEVYDKVYFHYASDPIGPDGQPIVTDNVSYRALCNDPYYLDGGAGQSTTTTTTTDVVTTTTTTSKQSRTGLETNVVVGPTKVTVDNKILNVAVDPWMRSITVNWSAKRLKPNTRHYIFFDDKDVTSNCTPSPITTDATGAVSGTFTIPAKTFRTGRRVFRICDDAQNRLNLIDSSADAQYNASGIIETNQKTITSTREAHIEKRTVYDTRVITSTDSSVSQQTDTDVTGGGGGGGDVVWVDPLAQSFLVSTLPGGYFVTGVDLFFRKKDSYIPITLQIREMENGLPTQRVIPFGEVVQDAADVNVSEDATALTHFSFKAPIYLKNGTEYCMVLMANSDNYEVWVAKIGGLEINTTNLISTTPYAGSLFKSKNASTWTPEQTEVMKFVMYRAKFDTGVTGKAFFQNPVLSSKTLETLKLYTYSGSNVVRVYHRNHGMPTGSKVTLTIPSGPAVETGYQNWIESYNGIAVSKIVPTIEADFRTISQPSGVADTVLGSRTYTVANVELDSYTISITDGANAPVNATSSGFTGVAVTVTQNRLIDVMMPQIQQLKFANTGVNWYYRGILGQSAHGTQTPYQREVAGVFPYSSMEPNQNIFFDAPRLVASAINEANLIKIGTEFDNKSLVFYAELSSTVDNLSPVIDTQRVSAITISNRIDNRIASDNPASVPSGTEASYVAESVAKGATAPHRYIHRPAVLEAVSNSLHVIVSVMRPSEATVEVWYRVLPAETNTLLSDCTWVKMDPTGTLPASKNNKDFRDCTFAADDIGKFTAFQTKIVTRSSNSSRVAICKDFRAIALDT